MDLAREKNVLLAENLWTRFLPIYARLREIIAEGGIGEVRVIHADYFFRMEFDPEDRFFNRAKGGGALLVKKIDGDFSNVVGLPVPRLAREIESVIR